MTNDERRELWAEELTEHGFEEFWNLLTEEEKSARREFADAAMAVADSEKADLVMRHAAQMLELSSRCEVKNSRLRAELTRSQNEEVEIRIENARLRAELEKARTRISNVRNKHKPRTEQHGSGCVQCGIVWPCTTYQGLEDR